MIRRMRCPALLLMAFLLALILSPAIHGAVRAAPGVGLLTVDGAIGPASADYIVRARRSAEQGQQLLMLKLDTPGGLDTSMREIIKDILASPVPVAGLRRPAAARAPPAPAPTSSMPATSRRWRRPPTSARRRRSRSASPSAGRDAEAAEPTAPDAASAASRRRRHAGR